MSVDDAVILAGGASRRMGREKALIEFDGSTLLARLARGLARRCERVWISCRHDGPSAALAREIERLRDEESIALATIPDAHRDAGPLAGVESALARIAGEAALFVAADVSYFDEELVDRLVAAAAGGRGAVPWVNGSPEPVFAVYAVSLAPSVSACLDAGTRRLRDLAALDGVARVDGQAAHTRGAFRTLNTPEDLASLLARQDSRADRSPVDPAREGRCTES